MTNEGKHVIGKTSTGPLKILNVYLAAAYSRKFEMYNLKQELESMGVHVTSRWTEEVVPLTDKEKWYRINAYMDKEDVLAADVFVRFTDDLSGPTVPSRLATGSRMYEQGLADGAGKTIIVVGGNQCLFDHLPSVIHLKDAGELKRFLSPVEIH
jgi:hypothetical protein